MRIRQCSLIIAVLAALGLLQGIANPTYSYAQVLSVRDADMQLMRGVEDQAHIALEILGGLNETDSPQVVVDRIDRYLSKAQHSGELPYNDWHEFYAPFGALWGEQIGRQYGWKWVNIWLDENEGAPRYAVVSPDNSMVIYPFMHLRACITEGATVSISRVFEVVGSEHRKFEFPSGSYTDLLASPAHLLLSK